jgi:hypothetical protein
MKRVHVLTLVAFTFGLSVLGGGCLVGAEEFYPATCPRGHGYDLDVGGTTCHCEEGSYDPVTCQFGSETFTGMCDPALFDWLRPSRETATCELK